MRAEYMGIDCAIPAPFQLAFKRWYPYNIFLNEQVVIIVDIPPNNHFPTLN